MKKKNICICSAQVPFVRGGAEMLVESLCEQLKGRDYNVEIVKIPYKWYPKNEIINSIFSWRMIDLSESNGQKIDLVIPTKFPSYAVKHENKVTWLMHQFRQIYDQYGTEFSDFIDNEDDNIIRNKIMEIDNKTLLESKQIFSIANNTTKRLKKYNNIDSEVLYHPPKQVGKYYCNEFDDYILSVGRLESVKRVDLLIKSLKYCDRNIKAIIAGTGPYKDELEKLAYSLGVNDRVEFLGFVSDEELLKLYANAFSIFFAPFDEDYGYITLEAFLSNKPIITSKDAGGVLEFAEDNVNSFICNVSPEEMGQSIQKLWLNKQLCEEFGNNGYNKVKDISWDIVIDKLTETIR
ncbi:glycosyltransferase family 4 protein [Clostridium butyricum]|uniref:glycosyltransferase family 4 protein n=1 Tax=Clostridium butyricum TaxID=1492 RepID=UPI00374F2A3B